MQANLSDEIETLEDLSRPEHLLVWALRAIALGHGDCPLIARTFDKACGPMAGRIPGSRPAVRTRQPLDALDE